MGFEDKRKKEKEQAPNDFGFKLTNQQCQDLLQKINIAGGKTKFLIEKHALVEDDLGMLAVVYDESILGHSAGYGFNYWSCASYDFWGHALSQVDDYISRVEYAKQMEILQLTGEKPKNKYLEKIREILKDNHIIN